MRWLSVIDTSKKILSVTLSLIKEIVVSEMVVSIIKEIVVLNEIAVRRYLPVTLNFVKEIVL